MTSSVFSVNQIILNPSPLLGGYPTVVGETPEFSDLLLFNGTPYAGTSFLITGANPVFDALLGRIDSMSVTVVPELSAALPGLGAAAGLLLRRRRTVTV